MKLSQSVKRSDWYNQPDTHHVVHFYPHNSALSSSLSKYIGAGLKAGETCIVIATAKHLAELNHELARAGHNVAAAVESGQYLVFDADAMLKELTPNNKLDYDRFLSNIVPFMRSACSKGPVRVYGEMVALLWKAGNLDAVLKLENFWNDLAQKCTFSLYCAYPQLYFDGSTEHKNVTDKISKCHSLTASATL